MSSYVTPPLPHGSRCPAGPVCGRWQLPCSRRPGRMGGAPAGEPGGAGTRPKCAPSQKQVAVASSHTPAHLRGARARGRRTITARRRAGIVSSMRRLVRPGERTQQQRFGATAPINTHAHTCTHHRPTHARAPAGCEARVRPVDVSLVVADVAGWHAAVAAYGPVGVRARPRVGRRALRAPDAFAHVCVCVCACHNSAPGE
jgi:hypothetical protein